MQNARPTCMVILMIVAGCGIPIGPASEHADHHQQRAQHHEVNAAARVDESSQRLTVGDSVIEAADFMRAHAEELRRERTTGGLGAYRGFVAQRAAQWIKDRTTEALLYQQASLRVTTEVGDKIDQYIDGQVRKTITAKHGGIQRRYEKALAAAGTSIERVRQQMRRDVIISSYLESVVRPKVAEPTRAELLAAFEANIDSWRKPARRKMSLIDVRVSRHLPDGVDEPTPLDLASARAEARSIIETARLELTSGVRFDAVARRYSDGLHAKEGGAWGFVTPGSVRARFEPAAAALFQIAPQSVSSVIETPDGFFLVRCGEAEGGHEPSFQAVQPELQQRLFRESYNRLVAERVNDLRKPADIDPVTLERFHAAVVEAALAFSPGDQP